MICNRCISQEIFVRDGWFFVSIKGVRNTDPLYVTSAIVVQWTYQSHVHKTNRTNIYIGNTFPSLQNSLSYLIYISVTKLKESLPTHWIRRTDMVTGKVQHALISNKFPFLSEKVLHIPPRLCGIGFWIYFQYRLNLRLLLLHQRHYRDPLVRETRALYFYFFTNLKVFPHTTLQYRSE